MTVVSPVVDFTIDAFLGGRVEAVQPASGHHRSGLEAVLLAAALDAGERGTVVDLGAGAGVAGMCAAARRPGIDVMLVERDPQLVDCAHRSLGAAANSAFAGRVRVAEVDITAPEEARLSAGLSRETSAAVLMNPPFYAPGAARASPSQARASAHILERGLDEWFRAAAWTLRPSGVLLVVALTSQIAELLAALSGRFGDASLLPLHPRPGRRAERLLVRAVRGRRAGPSILPGLTLHGPTGSGYVPQLEAVLRDGLGLSEIHPPWQTVSRSPS